jgi:hypothetical protein
MRKRMSDGVIRDGAVERKAGFRRIIWDSTMMAIAAGEAPEDAATDMVYSAITLLMAYDRKGPEIEDYLTKMVVDMTNNPPVIIK